MKGFWFVCGLAFTCLAHADQTWEKQLAPGVVFRQVVQTNPPLVVSEVRIKANAPGVELVACKSKGVVYDDTPEKGRETPSSMVHRVSGLIGVNGDFFHVPYTGESLGFFENHGEMVTSSMSNRTAVGWGEGPFVFGKLDWHGSLTAPSGTVAIDAMNHELAGDKIVLLSPAYGTFQLSSSESYVEAKIASGKLAPGQTLDLSVVGAGTSRPKGKIPAGEVLIAGCGKRASELAQIKAGDHLSANLDEAGFDWSHVTEAISGGPKLVTAGKSDIVEGAEGFNSAFSTTHHPRTAFGVTASGDMLLVVVDGRQPQSGGASLEALADLMIKLGCSDAVNLDGGGSSDMAIPFGALNRPSDGVERAVADGIVVRYTGPQAKTDDRTHQFAFTYPGHLDLTQTAHLKLADNGRSVGNEEIFWMSSGAAWVDQGGNVHPTRDGLATVRAYVRGTLVQATLTIGKVTDLNYQEGKRGPNEDGQ